MSRRLIRSTRREIGRLATALKAADANPTMRLTCVSVSARSTLIDCISSPVRLDAAEQRHDRQAEDRHAVPGTARTRPRLLRAAARRSGSPAACCAVVQEISRQCACASMVPRWAARSYFAHGRISVRARPHGLARATEHVDQAAGALVDIWKPASVTVEAIRRAATCRLDDGPRGRPGTRGLAVGMLNASVGYMLRRAQLAVFADFGADARGARAAPRSVRGADGDRPQSRRDAVRGLRDAGHLALEFRRGDRRSRKARPRAAQCRRRPIGARRRWH